MEWCCLRVKECEGKGRKGQGGLALGGSKSAFRNLTCARRAPCGAVLAGDALCTSVGPHLPPQKPISTTFLSPLSLCSPTYCKVVPGEGMPLLKDPRRRGDLLIHFNVCFPKRLTPDKKLLLRRALLS